MSIELPKERSAFLWGPRKVGKTTWLLENYPDAQYVDLRKTDTLASYASRPALLRERWQAGLTIIDEIQKAPRLLDEVHWLIENRGAQFILTGSSARKLRRGDANLLGGRAWRYELGPLSWMEVDDFELEDVFVRGLVAPHFTSPDPKMDLRAYVADYLREEIIEEARVRDAPAFSEFLRVAGITNGELLNYTNVARDTGVSAKVIRTYYEILEDTLLGFRLRPWTRSESRRLTTTDRFYLFDFGVANHLARRRPAPGTPEFGRSFEHYILTELLAYKRYRALDMDIRYWRSASGIEVDFVLGDMDVVVEAKATRNVVRGHLRGLRTMVAEHKLERVFVVSLDPERRVLDDGIVILPWRDFVRSLWKNEIYQARTRELERQNRFLGLRTRFLASFSSLIETLERICLTLNGVPLFDSMASGLAPSFSILCAECPNPHPTLREGFGIPGRTCPTDSLHDPCGIT
ncbi:MAG: AAA family ATPase, partial [Myxococcota bacterium]